MIRDYGQAASDLQRVISVLEKQSDGKAKRSGTPGSRSSSTKELRQANRRLSLMEEAAKKGTSLDLYLILGQMTLKKHIAKQHYIIQTRLVSSWQEVKVEMRGNFGRILSRRFKFNSSNINGFDKIKKRRNLYESTEEAAFGALVTA